MRLLRQNLCSEENLHWDINVDQTGKHAAGKESSGEAAVSGHCSGVGQVDCLYFAGRVKGRDRLQ